MAYSIIASLFCAAFIGYIVFGYPCLLAAVARIRQRPIDRKAPDGPLPAVSVIIPVRNGEAWIRRKLESLIAMDYPRELVEIIVVSDGSTDRTEQVAASFQGVRLISIPAAGKAIALNHGIAAARGEYLFMTDVRQEIAPDAVLNLLACFHDRSVGVATGELVIRDGATQAELNVGLYWKYEKWIRRNLSRLDSVLGATGAIYLVRRNLATVLPPDILLDDVYLPISVFLRGYRIVFESRAQAYDDPTSLHGEFRRKVRTQAGVFQLVQYFPTLLGPRNRMWFHFMSHKMGRLLLPYALIGLAVSAVFLPRPWSAIALVMQAAFYGLAVVDWFIPERFPLKRVFSLPRTFTVLVAAALCAVLIFFVTPQSLWKTAPQSDRVKPKLADKAWEASQDRG